MHRHALAARVMAAALSVGLFSSMALAQKQIIVQEDDGGGGPQVLQFSMPDFADLRTPDFTRRDLPIFTEKLVLSEAQAEAIGRMIDAYIQEFRALTKALAETAGPEAEFDPDEDPARGMAGRKLAAGLAGAGGPGELNFDDLQALIPPGTSIGISVGMDAGGGPGDGGAEPPAPRASVQVNLDPPEGEEIPQEVLDKIQQKADDMALRLDEQMQARMNTGAEAEENGPAPIKGVAMDDMNVEQMQAKIADMQEKFEEFRRDKAALRARFVTDAQTNLTEEQVARWPALERALTRQRSLPRGQFAGENVDLLQVLAALKLDESVLESLAPQLEAYEIELDTALKQRDAYLADADRHIDAAIADQKMDRAVQIADRSSDLRVAVRNVNQSHALQISEALGGERGEAFGLAALKACYPRVYQTTRGQKMFATAKQIEGLDEGSRQSLHDLEQAYEAELANVNQQIRGVMEREEPLRERRNYEQLQEKIEGQARDGRGPDFAAEREADPIRQVMSRRAELDDRYLDLVSRVLPPAQAANLPKPRRNKGPIMINSGSASS